MINCIPSQSALIGCSEANTESELLVARHGDFAEKILLQNYDRLQLDHLEHRQKQRDHGALRPLLLEQPHNEDRLVRLGGRQDRFEIHYHVGDAPVRRRDVINGAVLYPLQSVAESLDRRVHGHDLAGNQPIEQHA
jgi:hypothetical protein